MINLLVYLQKWKQLLRVRLLYNKKVIETIVRHNKKFSNIFFVESFVFAIMVQSDFCPENFSFEVLDRAFVLVIFHTGIWWNNLECDEVKMHVLVSANWNRCTISTLTKLHEITPTDSGDIKNFRPGRRMYMYTLPSSHLWTKC